MNQEIEKPFNTIYSELVAVVGDGRAVHTLREKVVRLNQENLTPPRRAETRKHIGDIAWALYDVVKYTEAEDGMRTRVMKGLSAICESALDMDTPSTSIDGDPAHV